MKLAAIASFLISTGVAFAAPATVSKRDTNVVTTYNGIDGLIVYPFGDCIPFRIDGALINSGQVNEFAKCYFYSDPNCQHQQSPVPVLVPPGVNFLNVADFVEPAGGSAICYELE